MHRPRPNLRPPALHVVALVVAATLVLLLAPFAPALARPIQLVAFGDSLTAGFGLPKNLGFAPRLEAALKAEGLDVEVFDAGLSGDTTDLGLMRLGWSVPTDSDGIIVELGANDALHGLPPESTRKNLEEIVGRLTDRGQKVLLAGMLAPRNLGDAYVAAFDPIFADVARNHGALLYPFFLDGVATEPKLLQPDGLHPTAEGIDVIVARILPKVRELIDRIRAARN